MQNEVVTRIVDGIMKSYHNLLIVYDVTKDVYTQWDDDLRVNVQDTVENMIGEAKQGKKIYTHEWATIMIDLLEDELGDNDIILNPDDEDREDCEDAACIYGDVFDELMAMIEPVLEDWADEYYPTQCIKDVYSDNPQHLC